MREKTAVKNGSITLVCQMIDVILGFIVRKRFIQYIGIAMLGVSGTFTSLLTALSLADLGFESAVVFSLYEPMKRNDTDAIEDTVSILKYVYGWVGLFILVFGILVSFFLPVIIKGIPVDAAIYTVYYLMLAGNAVTYFLAYKKSFLLAQQKDYIRNIYISVFKIAASILQILLLIIFHSFVLYVLTGFFQNLLTNISIARYVDRHYAYRFRKRVNRTILKKILHNAKDIFFGRIAGYVYSSTDNLIISACVGTVSVGLLGNYTQILYQLKIMISNVFASTRPIIGHYLTQNKNKAQTFQTLKNYTFIRFAVSTAVFVPGFVLCDCFIASWLGQDYILSLTISLLLVTDIFIHFVHGALVDYIAGCGYFSYDRNISVMGAVINLALSLALVQKIGVAGVLIGTVVSQAFFWASRGYVVFCRYFSDLKQKGLRYLCMCLRYIAVFYGLCFGCRWIFDCIPLQDSVLKFITGGGACFCVIVPVLVCLFYKTEEYRYFAGLAGKYAAKLRSLLSGFKDPIQKGK